MSFVTKSTSSTHTYRGSNCEINFFLDDDSELSVTIDTGRLHLRSVKPSTKDSGLYELLFGDAVVMSKYGTGRTEPREEVVRILDIWIKRWNQNDPYSGLAVLKNDEDAFLGNIALGQGDLPGEAILSYLFHNSHWGKGYGSEAATAVVREYAPATVEEGYTLKGKPLERILGTARTDNPASLRILEKVGMHYVSTAELYGAPRHHYCVNLSELQKERSTRISLLSKSTLIVD